MRDRMERLVILPFSVGCISEASVAVGIPQQTRRSPRQQGTNSPAAERSMKNSVRFLLIPKSTGNNVSTGFNKFFKGFKNLSQFFVEREEDLEELEMEEMEIGCPTDVQHVTHIGWDGNDNINGNPQSQRGLDHLVPPELLLSVSSISFQQYQLLSQEAQTQTQAQRAL